MLGVFAKELDRTAHPKLQVEQKNWEGDLKSVQFCFFICSSFGCFA